MAGKTRRRFAVAPRRSVTFVIAGVCLAGCGLPEQVARQTAQHTYREPCDAVLPAVREALRDRGYDPQLARADRAIVLETEWRTRPPPIKSVTNPPRYRYLARMTSGDDASCRLRVERESTDIVGPSSARDLDVEWEVLQRVEPASARQIRAVGGR